MAKIFGWAVVASVSYETLHALPIDLIVNAVCGFCLAATLHAVLLRTSARMYRTSWGTWLGRYISDRQVFQFGVAWLAVTYLIAITRDGGSLGRVVVCEAAYFLGLWLALHPREAGRSVLGQVRARARF
jgi:hypothetical protein